MKKIGIIAEYNPFHNGHKYQIDKIKEKYKDSLIIVVMSSSFCQRGEYSLLDKWTKTKICLENNIDLVVELPYVFSTGSADIFAKGAVEILNELNVDIICFGSESNDKEKLIKLASIQLNNPKFDNIVNKNINDGTNYPTAVNKALLELTGYNLNKSNDLLNISYIKEILKINNNIDIEIIKRTNDYFDLKNNSKIVSASNIRNKLLNKKSVKKYIPIITYKEIKKINIKQYEENYFRYLKYSIYSNINNLNQYHMVDEGIENRIIKYISSSISLDELINNIKTKRYTYNKILRMLNYIIVGFKKEDNVYYVKTNYIRILGFNKAGQKHLNSIKKDIKIPIISNYNDILTLENKVTYIYSLITNNNSLIEQEYKNKPILKE